MPTVDEFVRTSILTYPLLYSNRTEVLHHALCVLGNGYCWGGNGTVVALFDDQRPVWNKETELANLEKEMEQNYKHSSIRDIIRASRIELIEEEEQTIAEVDTLMHKRATISSFYPQHMEYALLCNMPENITEDWRAACEEMKVLAVEAGWKF